MKVGTVGSCLWWSSDGRVNAPVDFFAPRVSKPVEATKVGTVAAFDLDQTLIVPKSGQTWPIDGNDWKWLTADVVTKIRKEAETHHIVVFTNQGGTLLKGKRYEQLIQKMPNIIKELAVPIHIYAATKEEGSIYRKPEVGMWELMEKQLAREGITVDKKGSFYVGDAAGRPSDHSSSDLEFANNLDITFKTPEQWLETDIN